MEKKNNKHVLEIKIDGKEWQDAIDNAFKKKQKDIKLDGFRKGKVPYEVFIKNYGIESLFSDAIDLVIDGAYLKVLSENNLEPVARPMPEITEIDENGIKFSFTIITKPEVNIKKYKGLKVKKDSAVVTEDEINHEIEHLLERYSELAIKDGKVENGDTVILDYEGFKDGVAFDGGKALNATLEIGSDSFIPGFEKQLIGMEKNSEKEIEVTFPEDYHSEELKGAKAIFKIKIHEIKAREQRAFDAELFEDIGMEGVDSEESLRAEIKIHLETHKNQDIENKFVDDMLDAIAKNTEVDIPDEMVNDEVDRLLEKAEQNLKAQGITLDLYYQFTGTKEEDLRSQLEKEGFRNVLYRLILEELIKLENIEITDEEVHKELDVMSKKYQTSSAELEKELGGHEMVKYDLQMRHVFEKLTEYNEAK